MLAARQNNLDMVKMLLDAKAEVNVQNKVSEESDKIEWHHATYLFISLLFHTSFGNIYSISTFFVADRH
jgi:ankyrin repeat protein